MGQKGDGRDRSASLQSGCGHKLRQVMATTACIGRRRLPNAQGSDRPPIDPAASKANRAGGSRAAIAYSARVPQGWE